MFTRHNTQKPVTGISVNRSHPLSKGLVGLWLMNEGGGNTVADLSGNGSPGVLVGSGVTWVPGQFGPCLDFSGVDNNYVVTSSKPNPAVRAVSLWLKSDDTSTLQEVVSQWGGGGAGNASFLVRLLNNEIQFHTYDGGAAADDHIDFTDTTNWHHIFCQITAAGVIEIYDNGVLGVTKAGSPIPQVSTAYNICISCEAADLGDSPVNGKLDNILLYNRALTAGEVGYLHREPLCMLEQDPWPFYAGAVSVGAPVGNAGIMTTNTGWWGPTY